MKLKTTHTLISPIAIIVIIALGIYYYAHRQDDSVFSNNPQDYLKFKLAADGPEMTHVDENRIRRDLALPSAIAPGDGVKNANGTIELSEETKAKIRRELSK